VAGLSDEDLVLAVQAGDTQSLGELVARWQQPLYRFVSRMAPRPEDAHEVCQETFVRILRNAKGYRRGARFSTWMYQIALNLCRDQARRRRRWSLIVDDSRDADDPPAPRDDPASLDPARVTERRELADSVRRALAEIPREQREVLVLKEFEGLKFREIAEILDCPESTVKSRMYYGLSGLRDALARQGIHHA
jgi:RNA polymerase sigma-70 factor (ECF subfamily)